MKTLLALLLIPAAGPAFAQTPAANPKLSRIVVSVKVIEAPAAVVNQLLKTLPPGHGQPNQLYEALMLGPVREATELSLQTASDIPGVAAYNKIVGFNVYDHTKMTHNFVTLVNSLEATPHLESDHSISLQFSLKLSRPGKQTKNEAGKPVKAEMAVPPVVSTSLTTIRHCVDGETILIPISTPSYSSPLPDMPTQELWFVTATVLPAAPAAAGNKTDPSGI